MAKSETPKNYKLVYSDLAERGIDRNYFDQVYSRIENNDLFNSENIPPNQYTSILNYLKEQKVLKGNRIDKKALKLFDSRLKLEQRIEEISFPDIDDDGPSGGVAPCRHEHDMRGSGGVMPCKRH